MFVSNARYLRGVFKERGQTINEVAQETGIVYASLCRWSQRNVRIRADTAEFLRKLFGEKAAHEVIES